MARCTCKTDVNDIKKTTIWKTQYAPREKILKARLDKPTWLKYQAMSIGRKIQLIDKLQAKGEFD